MSEREANASKRKLDRLAGDLLGLAPRNQAAMVSQVCAALIGKEPLRLSVTGGAGSGKTSFAKQLGTNLQIPVYDFDDYIPGGWHRDVRTYHKRLVEGMESLQDALPRRKEPSWIIEHVEACNEEMLSVFQPNYCLHLAPDVGHVLSVAGARSSISKDPPTAQYLREQRALESTEIARRQFREVPGEVVGRGVGWVLKKTS